MEAVEARRLQVHRHQRQPEGFVGDPCAEGQAGGDDQRGACSALRLDRAIELGSRLGNRLGNDLKTADLAP